MPIRPDLRHMYLTQEWAAARTRILKRARGRCEQCHKPMNCSIYTYTWATWRAQGFGRIRVYHMVWARTVGSAWRDQSGRLLPRDRWPAKGLPRRIRVQLGVAHVDPAGEFYDDSNLRAWCTWCHLMADKNQHREARSSRKDRSRPILAQEQAS